MNSNIFVTQLRCEYGVNPLGLDTPTPRFSWVVAPSRRGAGQSAYRLQVFDGEMPIWDTGKVDTDQMTNIPYGGLALQSFGQYRWEVQVWDNDGVPAQAQQARFEMAMLFQDDWKAQWIRGGDLMRRDFTADRQVAYARAYVCGLGYYELYLNGKKVGDHVLDPAWTDFDQIAYYATYDITDALRHGKNAVGIMLGNGRYCPYESTRAKNWHPLKKYGSSPVLIYQQRIVYTDGSEDVLVSDSTWRVSEGPVTFNDIYDGEHYDATREQPGWNAPGFPGETWRMAVPVEEKMGILVSQGTFPPIRVIKPRTAVSLTQPAPGRYLYDFGQNFSGWVHLRVCGPRGTKVRMHFAELKDEKTGMLCPNTNRNAEATDIYVCKGEGLEEFEPHFTYHGFRYVELSGFPGTPSIDSVEGRVVHSDVERIGSFSCGNELINRIHSNYIWTQVSNLHSVPTDCCQRDERMGWVGDAQLSAEAAVHNFDMAAFYSKFERDIRLSQLENGSVAGVSPPYWSCYPADPTYATACVEFPRVVSTYYGDTRIIEESLDAMARWVDYMASQADEDGIVSFGLFGDWCPPMHANPVETPFEITSTWYYAFDALLVSGMAEKVGRVDIAQRYQAVFEKVTQAFNKRFLKGDRYSASRFSDAELAEKIKSWLNVLPPEERPAIMKRYATLYSSSSQTANLLPLYLGIVPEENRPEVVRTLIHDITFTRAGHINTGVVGLKFLFDVLVDAGEKELAFQLLNQDSFPSFGYQILKEGATTLWERWEYLANDQCFNSHSHPFAGSVDVFFYKYLAGIRQTGSGYSNLEIRPVLCGDLPYASASVRTVRGLVSCAWERNDHSLQMHADIPCGAKALIYVPKNGWTNARITESGVDAAHAEGLQQLRTEEDCVVYAAAPGAYDFTVYAE